MRNWNENDFFPLAIAVLQNDGIMLAASDTVLGLFAQLSEHSKNKLDSIKQRNLKPYIVLIQSAKLLYKFTDQLIDPSLQKIIDVYWPGPLTIIFKAKSTLPKWMMSAQETIAIRVPDHQGLHKLLVSVDALFTTSANISDQPLPARYAEIDPMILDQVQLICCQLDKVYDGAASTIVDFSSGSMKVIRSGAVIIDSI